LVKEEFDNLQKFYYSKTLSIFPKHICPEPIFGASYPDYNSVITLLKSACKEDSKTYTKTRAAVDEIENLFGILKSQGYQDIQLGCILMEYIPGQTLLEKKKKIKKKKKLEKKYYSSVYEVPTYQAYFINAISKIIFLFMEGYFLDDCHLGNIIVENIIIENIIIEELENKKRKREDETEEENALKILSKKSFDSRLIDLDRVYKRTQIYEDESKHEDESKEAFIERVKNILHHYDDYSTKIDELDESFIINLIKSNEVMPITNIKNIHDLRIILSIIRGSGNEYAWLDQFIYDDEFLSNLFKYLSKVQFKGGKSKKTKTKSKKTKTKSKKTKSKKLKKN